MEGYVAVGEVVEEDAQAPGSSRWIYTFIEELLLNAFLFQEAPNPEL